MQLLLILFLILKLTTLLTNSYVIIERTEPTYIIIHTMNPVKSNPVPPTSWLECS